MRASRLRASARSITAATSECERRYTIPEMRRIARRDHHAQLREAARSKRRRPAQRLVEHDSHRPHVDRRIDLQSDESLWRHVRRRLSSDELFHRHLVLERSIARRVEKLAHAEVDELGRDGSVVARREEDRLGPHVAMHHADVVCERERIHDRQQAIEHEDAAAARACGGAFLRASHPRAALALDRARCSHRDRRRRRFTTFACTSAEAARASRTNRVSSDVPACSAVSTFSVKRLPVHTCSASNTVAARCTPPRSPLRALSRTRRYLPPMVSGRLGTLQGPP